ncbi:hypothetical protein BDV32DRAFT_117760 [Aspergillus pseudonomiae]|nr:hypothetical protein BDV32DRAFT_117760 [Aspergillus pseudonomiae]
MYLCMYACMYMLPKEWSTRPAFAAGIAQHHEGGKKGMLVKAPNSYAALYMHVLHTEGQTCHYKISQAGLFHRSLRSQTGKVKSRVKILESGGWLCESEVLEGVLPVLPPSLQPAAHCRLPGGQLTILSEQTGQSQFGKARDSSLGLCWTL